MPADMFPVAPFIHQLCKVEAALSVSSSGRGVYRETAGATAFEHFADVPSAGVSATLNETRKE